MNLGLSAAQEPKGPKKPGKGRSDENGPGAGRNKGSDKKKGDTDNGAPRVPKGDGKCIYCGGKHFVKDCPTLPEERKGWTWSQHLAAKRKKEKDHAGNKSRADSGSAARPGGGKKALATGSAEHPRGGKNPSFQVQQISARKMPAREQAKVLVRQEWMGPRQLEAWVDTGQRMEGAIKQLSVRPLRKS